MTNSSPYIRQLEQDLIACREENGRLSLAQAELAETRRIVGELHHAFLMCDTESQTTYFSMLGWEDPDPRTDESQAAQREADEGSDGTTSGWLA